MPWSPARTCRRTVVAAVINFDAVEATWDLGKRAQQGSIADNGSAHADKAGPDLRGGDGLRGVEDRRIFERA